jgi:hypothetical protein
MNAIIHCPACDRKVQLPSEFLGRAVQCPECRQTFVAKDIGTALSPDPVPAAAPRPEPRAEPPAARYEDSRDPYEPERRRRRRRDYDDDRDFDEPFDDWGMRRSGLRPDHGGLVLALGIISVVIPCVVGLICGPIAFFLGTADLAAIDRGEMSPANRSMVQAGRIIGLCGAIWSLLQTFGTLAYFLFLMAMMRG